MGRRGVSEGLGFGVDVAVLVTCILVGVASTVDFAGLAAGFGDTAGAEGGEDSPSVENYICGSIMKLKDL